jgi:glycyl-tRNA synthetase beta chain
MTTNDFLVEILTEELPPKALLTLATSFHEQLIQGIRLAGLSFATSCFYATPRRLAVHIEALETQQEAQTIERKGPSLAAAYDKEGNPSKAALGFARSCGIDLSETTTTQTDKGEWLFYQTTAPGKTAFELLPALVEQALAHLPVPKVMSWGDSQHTFVRPVHHVLMMFGEKTVDATLFGLPATNTTYGHRFHHPEKISLKHPRDYRAALKNAHVIADFDERKTLIQQQIQTLAKKQKAKAVISDALLNEVTSIVEWPNALLGQFDQQLLQVPKEALTLAMESHQKSFSLTDTQGNLLPQFITVSNIESKEPKQVIHGNERVMAARLSDAEFFFETDKRIPLAERVEKLQAVIFQKQLGTLAEKVSRVTALTAAITEQMQGDVALAKRAGELSKADLVTDMVGEFPELQGVMGRYYAHNDNEPEEAALALDELYMPRFSGDQLPTSKTGQALALADRIDTLVGIFGINKPPTGSKDPFALRRAALGVLRIIIEKQLDLDLRELFALSAELYGDKIQHEHLIETCLTFCNDRLKHWSQEQGIPPSVFAAVAAKKIGKPYDIQQRLDAVNAFMQLPEATALAAANKRVHNILSKQGGAAINTVDFNLLEEDAEKILAEKLAEKTKSIAPLNYQDTLFALADLQQPIDRFFDDVMVMVDDEKIKHNRLALLGSVQRLFGRVADVSLLVK